MLDITAELFTLKDESFKEFNKKIIPDSKKPMLGVKLPKIREIVNKIDNFDDAKIFFNTEHVYFEEVMAHGLLIAKFCKNAEDFTYLDEFLPQIDNWAICDTTATSIKKLAKNETSLWQHVIKWLKSDKIYTVRFAIVCLLAFFSEKKYSDRIIELVLSVKHGEYYVDMAIAWLLSVMLIKDYEKTVALLKMKVLPRFIQNKTLDKARDSFRIENNKKIYLKTLKV